MRKHTLSQGSATLASGGIACEGCDTLGGGLGNTVIQLLHLDIRLGGFGTRYPNKLTLSRRFPVMDALL